MSWDHRNCGTRPTKRRRKNSVMCVLRPAQHKMPSPSWILVLMVSQSVLQALSQESSGNQFKTSACYGNINDFLKIGCPLHMKVKITQLAYGAKPLAQDCPLPTVDVNNRTECCSYVDGDCYIVSRNAFPTECQNVNNCQPRATWADTSKDCNNNIYPPQTHYMEVTYTCVSDKTTASVTTSSAAATPAITSTSVTTTTAATTGDPVNNVAAVASPAVLSRTLGPSSRSHLPSSSIATIPTYPVVIEEKGTSGDSFTPAMVGGMIAGIVGLLLTILIFIFYWGRKRKIRISGKAQNTVWDFLLSNSMSVRTFRGYDNFSSARSSVSSSDDGSPVIRKNVWLPNISVDSGHGETITSDDNCSVFTIERTPQNRL